MPVVNLKPLATLEGGGGSGGPTSPDDIVGASPTGKTVLTGDALAGRNAIAAAAATDVSALDERVDDLETDVAAIPAPKTWSTIDGKPPVIAAGTNQATARGAIGAAAASDLGSKADATTVTALASTVANKADSSTVAATAATAATNAINGYGYIKRIVFDATSGTWPARGSEPGPREAWSLHVASAPLPSWLTAGDLVTDRYPEGA